MVRRVFAAFSAAIVVAALTASVAFAGEITGNGRLLPVNGRSACANSGQEDLQWFTTDLDVVRHDVTRGVPAHSQNWGHFFKMFPGVSMQEFRDLGFLPGVACNPNSAQPEP
jgi:hypothetical protein